jgi:polysaccharide export outer membrane protein
MKLRLAPLMMLFLVLGGCAQDNLGALTALVPADIIYDAPAPRPDANRPTPVAAWGETVVRTGEATTEPATKPIPVAAWGQTVIKPAVAKPEPPPAQVAPTTPAPTKVADWGEPMTYRAPRQQVSPVPVGPPVAWGPAVVAYAAPSGGPTGHEPYILDTGDRLRVFVYGQPNLSRLYVVDQVGNIAVPLIGSVRARGRTTVELERTIRAQLGRDYVKDPQVTVDIAQNRPFFILGEVRLPGQYPYVSGMTIEQAVAIGGGYTERASQRSYRITRKLGALVDQIEAPGDYTLCPGDTVFVYERFF